MDFYEDLKQSGDDPAIDPNLTRTPPQPTIGPDAPAPAEGQDPPAPSGVPVKRRMAKAKPKEFVRPVSIMVVPIRMTAKVITRRVPNLEARNPPIIAMDK